MTGSRQSYYEVLTAALNDMLEHGYDSPERVAYWQRLLREAAERETGTTDQMERQLREALGAVYKRYVETGKVMQFHPGVARFTIERLKPQMRLELDKRILASANLIKLNKQNAVNKTLQRFAGWSTSIPAGGTKTQDRREEKEQIRKPLKQHTFEERRVLIDQGHKLTASISEVIAKDQNAIAVIWHSHWRQAGYNYREDHKERDQKVYLLRGNWASEKGLVKPGPAGYYEDITAVAVEPFCRCRAQWVFNVGSLPKDMLTVKGAAELQRAREMANAS